MRNSPYWLRWPRHIHMPLMLPLFMGAFISFHFYAESMQTSVISYSHYPVTVHPTLTGHAPPSDSIRFLLALPLRLGGLGIVNPTDFKHSASMKQSSPLRDLILEHDPLYSYEVLEAQTKAKSEVRRQRKEMLESAAGDLRPELPTSLRRAMDLAQEKGASSWLTALPIDEFGFTPHKSAFRDALALRYGWPPSRTPTTCACCPTSLWSMLFHALKAASQ